MGFLKVPTSGEVEGGDLIAKVHHGLAQVSLSSIDLPKLLDSLVIEVKDSVNNSLPGDSLGVLAHGHGL